MGKIPKKAKNMILLEFPDLSINNLFGEIARGIFGLSFLGYMNFHTTIFREHFHYAPNLKSFDALSDIANVELNGTPLSQKKLAKIRMTLKIPGYA